MKECHRFGKSERIRRNFEYKRVREKGTFYKEREDLFSLTVLKNNIGFHRLGLSISTSKVPLASKRNRIKRLIREVFRLNKMKLKRGPYDIVISIIKAPSCKLNYSIVEKKLQILLKKADAL